MKVLIDMNVAPRWKAFLASEGIPSVHWTAIGGPGDRDETIISYARHNGYVVLTSDLDFGLTLRAGAGAKPCVIQLKSALTGPEIMGDVVSLALRRIPQPLQHAILITIDESKSLAFALFKMEAEVKTLQPASAGTPVRPAMYRVK